MSCVTPHRFFGATKRLVIASLVTAALLSACGDTTGPKSQGTQLPELTALPRALTASEVQVRDASNAFSFALLSKVNAAQPAENVFISPLSASFALGMTMNGAANTTFTEMRSALQFGAMSQGDINASYKSLVALLLSLDTSTTLAIANSIWYRNTFAFRPTFFDTTAKYFGATVKPLDFTNKVASLATINGWVSNATNTRIPMVLDDITNDQVMFLINAIYFKGTWRNQFDPAMTTMSAFTPTSGAAQTTSLLRRTAEISYAETATYQAVDLPYGNGSYSMTVLLPKTGTDVNVMASALTSTSMQALVTSFHARLVALSLPKLKLSYERKLNDDLKALGMRAAFNASDADFTNMAPARDVYISFVKQNTFVDVNEEGTEAAAVTTVGAVVTSAPVAVTMRVDRPYVFAIRERLSGTVLFLGRIVRIP
jgi:serine protease inhibitor